ncbi:DNA polymerase I [Ancrocorticia populi]|uniref:DNA polymerase I n=2 Tax=Ancrocorticia populi TaxID=2175228 RepID=UPI003F9DF979
MTDERILLIDGNSMAFRAFYALRADSFLTSQGQYTNAVYGFTNTLLKMMADYSPTHVAVAFDLPGGTFRTRQFPDYKGGRAKTPEEFKGQISVIQETLDVLGITWLSVEDFEADDIVATLSARAGELQMHSYIASGDKDAYQLVSDDCTLLYPMPRSQMQVLDPAGVEEKTSVTPTEYPDLAALVGEGADNLPGVPGVGPKTAAKWIHEYGDLESILAHAEDIKGRAGSSLREHTEQVRLNRELNRLVRDLPIGADFDAFKLRGVDRESLHELFDALDFKSLRTRVLQELPARDGSQVEETDGLNLDDLEVTGEDLSGWFASHASPVWGLALTGSFAPGRGEIESIAIADQSGHVFSTVRSALSPQDEDAFASWLADPTQSKVCHGAKEYWHGLHGAGDFRLVGVTSDTVLAAYLLHPDQRDYDLHDLALRYLGVDIAEETQMLPGLGGSDGLASAAAVVVPLAEALRSALKDQGEDGALLDLELEVSSTLQRMEETGIKVSDTRLEELRTDFHSRVEAAAEAAYEAIGHEVNLSSPKQLQTVLFDELGLPKTKKTKSGYTTNAEALADLAVRIAEREDDQALAGQTFLGALLEHRDAIKLRQSVEGLQRSVLTDGRIHTTYQQAVAATGRLSSTDPNLQNIHARTEEGLQIREAFVPGNGFVGLMTADYSQIEMRLMASLSGDQELIDAFNHGADLHTYVASRVFGISEDEVSGAQRSRIKAMSYGLVYGLSAFGLSRQLRIEVSEAQRLMDDYFSRFGKVRDYLNHLVDRAREQGYTETMLGRRRYLPELTSTNRQLREGAERMALNAPIQGSAADIIKLAMVDVARDLKEAGLASRVLLQVHDELVVEVAEGEREKVELLLRHDMGGAADLAVPLSVGIGYGENWRAAAH